MFRLKSEVPFEKFNTEFFSSLKIRCKSLPIPPLLLTFIAPISRVPSKMIYPGAEVLPSMPFQTASSLVVAIVPFTHGCFATVEDHSYAPSAVEEP